MRRSRAAALMASRVRVPIAVLLGLVAVYSLATIVFFWPWFPELRTSLIGPPEDNMQDFWGTYYVAVASAPDEFFFTNLLRFPEGTPLYFHTLAFPKVFTIAILTRLLGTDTPTLVLLHNLSLLVSFPVAGIGAFYLVRHLTGSATAGLVGGFIFAFNPSHVAHTPHHIGVSSIEFIPFFVLAYLLAIERRSVLWMLGAVACYALSALLHWYHLFYLAYFVAFHTVYDAIRRRTLPRGWRLFAPIACLAAVAIVLSPLLVPMALSVVNTPSIAAAAPGMFADLAAYVAFPPSHVLSALGEGVYWRMSANPWEGTVYLGLVNLTLLAWLLLRFPDRDSRLLAYAFSGMLLFGMLSTGPRLHVLGQPTIPMPDMLLSNLPFFSLARGASRAVVFVYLFLAVAVGHAFAVMWRNGRSAARRALLVAVAALIVTDFVPAQALPMTSVSCSPGLVLIRDDPDRNFGVLNLPKGRMASSVEGNYYMFQQVCHGRPICQGTVSRDVVKTLRDRLEIRNFDAQRRQLTEARVKYIVINHPVGSLYRWRAEDGPREQYAATYPAVYDGPDMTVLRVY